MSHHQLQQPRVRKSLHKHVCAVQEIRARVAVSANAACVHTRPHPLDLTSFQARLRTSDAAVRADLPRLGEGITQYPRGRVITAVANRGSPCERVDHSQHVRSPDREVEPTGLLQRTREQTRPRLWRTKNEDGLTDLMAIDDQDVADGSHAVHQSDTHHWVRRSDGEGVIQIRAARRA